MYQKGKELYLVSDEAFELLQLGIRVDTSLRKLSVYAMEQKYPYERYSQTLSKVTDAIFVYRQFIDNLFTTTKSSLVYQKDNQNITQEVIRGVLNFLRKNGKWHFVRISTNPAKDIFAYTKSTDVIIRMCVELGWNDVQRAILLKQSISTEIEKLKLSADECYREFWNMKKQLESRRERKKKDI